MQYANVRPSGLIATGIDEGDSSIGAAITDGKSEVMLATKHGMAIRFAEDDVRSMGRTATGVKGITLDDKRRSGVARNLPPTRQRCSPSAPTATASAPELAEYRDQSRGGKGVITIKTTDRNGEVVGALPWTTRRGRCCRRIRHDDPHEGERDPPGRPQHPRRALDQRPREASTSFLSQESRQKKRKKLRSAIQLSKPRLTKAGRKAATESRTDS